MTGKEDSGLKRVKYCFLVEAELKDGKKYRSDAICVESPGQLTAELWNGGTAMMIKALERKNNS